MFLKESKFRTNLIMILKEFLARDIANRIEQKYNTSSFDDEYFELSKSISHKLNALSSENFQDSDSSGDTTTQEDFILDLYDILLYEKGLSQPTIFNFISNFLYYLNKFKLPVNFKIIQYNYFDAESQKYKTEVIDIPKGVGVSLYLQYIVARYQNKDKLLTNPITKRIYGICSNDIVLDYYDDKELIDNIISYFEKVKDLIMSDKSDGHPTEKFFESVGSSSSLADNSFSAYFYNRKNGLIDIGSASSELRSRIKKFSGFVYAGMKNCHHWWAIDNNGSNLEKLGFSEDDIEDIKEELGVDDLLELADDRDFMAETGEDFEYLMSRIYKRGNLQIRVYSDLITVIVKNLSKYGKSLVVDFLASNSWIYDNTPDKQISVYQADDDSAYNTENGKYRELLKKLLESKDKKLSPLTEFFEFVQIC